MNALIVSIVLVGLLFFIAYATRRRFGLLGLGLCAGALLSSSWTGTLVPAISAQGVVLTSPPLATVVASMLILLPPLLLLLSGPSYDKPLWRIAGAAAFAILAFTLLSAPLSTGLVFDEVTSRVFVGLDKYSSAIITVGVVLAVLDVLLSKSSKRTSSHK